MKRRLFACLFLCGLPFGSAAAQSLNEPVPGMESVVDMQSFWLNELRLSPEGGEVFAKMPPSYQDCVAKRLVEVQSSEVAALVSKFVADKTYGNYVEMIQPMLDFVKAYEQEHGEKPGPIAGRACIQEMTQ